MAINKSVDPGSVLKVAIVNNNPMAQLVSSTLISTGSKIYGAMIQNNTNTATYVHLCDEAAATGNISVTSFLGLGVAASDTEKIELPVPYTVSAGITVKMNLSNATTYIWYEK